MPHKNKLNWESANVTFNATEGSSPERIETRDKNKTFNAKIGQIVCHRNMYPSSISAKEISTKKTQLKATQKFGRSLWYSK